MTEHEGWSYLDSDGVEEFAERSKEGGWAHRGSDGSGSYYGNDGSWGYMNADGSGSFYGADGSWGYRNADGSSSYYGEDGSWGYRNADGSGSFYGEGADWGHWDSDGNKTYYEDADDEPDDEDNSDSGGIGIAGATVAAIGAGLLAAAAAAGGTNKEEEAELERAREEEERRRQERAEKRKEWRKSPTGRKVRKAGFIMLAILIAVLSVSLLICSLRVVGRSSSEMVGSSYSDAVEQLREAGFWKVEQTEISDLTPSQADQDGLVTNVRIGFFESFSEDLKVPCFITPEVTYHTLVSLNPPLSSEDVKGMDYRDVVSAFESAGYLNVVAEPRKDVVIGFLNKEGEVSEVSIGDTKSFTLEDAFKPDLTVTIIYHSKVFG